MKAVNFSLNSIELVSNADDDTVRIDRNLSEMFLLMLRSIFIDPSVECYFRGMYQNITGEELDNFLNLN